MRKTPFSKSTHSTIRFFYFPKFVKQQQNKTQQSHIFILFDIIILSNQPSELTMEININTEHINVAKQVTSIFPALLGTNKSISAELEQQLFRYKIPALNTHSHKIQDEGKFLTRMKQARELILYHKKRTTKKNIKSPPTTEKSSSSYQLPKYKTEDDEKIYPKFTIEQFKKQHSYSLHSQYEPISNKQTIPNQKYQHNKVMRNSNHQLIKNSTHFDHTQGKTFRSKLYLMKNISLNQNNPSSTFQPRQRKIRKNQKDRKLLMNLDLSDQLINENCGKLVEKLIKCRNVRNGDISQKINEENEDKLSTIEKSHKKIQQETKFSEKTSRIGQKSTSLTSWKKSLSKLKIQFQFQRNLQNKKQRCRMTFRKAQQLLTNPINTSFLLPPPLQDKPKKQPNKQLLDLLPTQSTKYTTTNYASKQFQLFNPLKPIDKYTTKLKINKREKLFSSIKTKTVFQGIEANFKLQGWNMKQPEMYQYQIENAQISKKLF